MKIVTALTIKFKTKTNRTGLEYPMYHSDSGAFKLDDSSEKYLIDIKLEPNHGGLTINTSPESGVKVIIDGVYSGYKTPCTINRIKKGEHLLSLRSKWYSPIDTSIVVDNRHDININMTPNYGYVNIVADNKTDVFIDGVSMGVGSWEGKLLLGYHIFELKKEGYYPKKSKVKIGLGKNKDISLNQIGKFGKIKIITDPFGSDVILDEVNYGKSPITIPNILIGEHSLSIEKNGYITYNAIIKVNEDKTTSIDKSLDVFTAPIEHEVPEEKYKRDDRKIKGLFMYYHYDKVSPVGFGLGYLRERWISGYGSLKMGMQLFNSDQSGFNIYTSGGITLKLFSRIWANAGLGTGYRYVSNIHSSSTYSKFEIYPEYGLNMILGKRFLLKIGSQYNVMEREPLTQVGIGLVL